MPMTTLTNSLGVSNEQAPIISRSGQVRANDKAKKNFKWVDDKGEAMDGGERERDREMDLFGQYLKRS